MPKLANTITVDAAASPTAILGKIPIKPKHSSLRKKGRTAALPSAAASTTKNTLKRSESQEMLANEERAKLLISRLNQDIPARPMRGSATIEASSPDSILRNAAPPQTDSESK